MLLMIEGSDGIRTTITMMHKMKTAITQLISKTFAPGTSSLPSKLENTEEPPMKKNQPIAFAMNSKGAATVIPDKAASELGIATVTRNEFMKI